MPVSFTSTTRRVRRGPWSGAASAAAALLFSTPAATAQCDPSPQPTPLVEGLRDTVSTIAVAPSGRVALGGRFTHFAGNDVAGGRNVSVLFRPTDL